MLWNEKYAPKKLSEFAGNPSACHAVRTWALDWERGIPGKPLLLFGPPGVGKGALVRALAQETGWEMVEANSSEQRNRDGVSRVIGSAASSGSLSGARKLVFIDDIDALSGNADRGGMAAVAEVLKTARNPVIATAGDYYDKKISGLRPLATAIEFRKVNSSTIASVLSKILEGEGIAAPKEVAAKIADASKGDLRSAVNDLQAVAEGRKTLTAEEADRASGSFGRDREKKIFDAIRALLKATTYEDAQRSQWNVDADPDTFALWVEENVPLEYSDARDLARAFNSLSRADVFNGRIRSRQYWGFLRYSNILTTAGVALAKSRPYPGYVQYRFPSYLRKMGGTKSSRAKMREVGRKIGARTHSSAREAGSVYLPLVRTLLEGSATARETAEYFDLGIEDVAFITGKSEKQAEKLVSPAREAGREAKRKEPKKAPAKRKASGQNGLQDFKS